MPLVYVREANFASWFGAWSREQLSAAGFSIAARELIAPTVDTAAAAARRMLPAVSRLHTTLTGYLAALERLTEEDDRIRLRAWLQEGLRTWLEEAAPEIRQPDVNLVFREIRATDEALDARAAIRGIEQTQLGVSRLPIEDPAAVRQLAATIEGRRDWLAVFAEERGDALGVRIGPLDQLFELRQSVLALGASLESGQPLPDDARHLLFSDASRQTLAMVIGSVAPPYDSRKRLPRLLDPVYSADSARAFRSGASGEGAARTAFDELSSGATPGRPAAGAAECRIIAGDLRLLHWLASTDAFEHYLGSLTHRLKGASQHIADFCLGDLERPVYALPGFIDGVARAAGATISTTLDWVASSVGPEFGLVPSTAFRRECERLFDAIPAIVRRLQAVRELDAAELRAVVDDTWQSYTFAKQLSSRERFAEMFDDFAAELLREGHDART